MAAMIGGHHKLTNVRLYLPSSIMKSYDFTHTLPLLGNLGRQVTCVVALQDGSALVLKPRLARSEELCTRGCCQCERVKGSYPALGRFSPPCLVPAPVSSIQVRAYFPILCLGLKSAFHTFCYS